MKMLRLQGEFERRQGLYYEFDMESRPLGEGGMGRVFRGYRVVISSNSRTPVAIKVVYDGMPESVIERARREASIQMDNDNLIRMYSFVEAEVRDENRGLRKICYYLVMELLVGVTLDDWLKGIFIDKQGVQIAYANQLYNMYLQNREEVVVKIIKNVLSGVMALHDSGFIHRDIDPTNIMITHDGKIKLIDFGICKQIVSLNSPDQSLTTFGTFIGKANYAAPELVRGNVSIQNETTDIYAIGVLFYQLYIGQLPFSGTTEELKFAHLYKKISIEGLTHSGIRKVILKATNKKQELRYASAAEFRVALEHLRLSDKKNYPSFKTWKWGAIVGGLSVLLVSVVLVLYNLYIKKHTEDAVVTTNISSVDGPEIVMQKSISQSSSQNQDTLLHLKGINNTEVETTQSLSKTFESEMELEPEIKIITLDISENKLNYSEEGGTEVVKIKTNDPKWRATGKVSWCNVQKGADYCRIIVARNTSYKKRNNQIRIIAGDIEKVIEVVQEPVQENNQPITVIPVPKNDHSPESQSTTETKQNISSPEQPSQLIANKNVLLNGHAVDEREFDIKTTKKSDNMIILRGQRKSAARVSVEQTLELSFPLDNPTARISFCRTESEEGKAMFFYSSINMKGISFTKEIDKEQHICRLRFSFSSRGEYVVYVQGRKSYVFIGVD